MPLAAGSSKASGLAAVAVDHRANESQDLPINTTRVRPGFRNLNIVQWECLQKDRSNYHKVVTSKVFPRPCRQVPECHSSQKLLIAHDEKTTRSLAPCIMNTYYRAKH